VELQESMADFKREGVAVFAISYDPVPVLADLAERHGITYTLLSDEGSRVIRELGLLNRHIDAQHAFYGVEMKERHYGTPYPGLFIVDENGIVESKQFEQSYRVRPTAPSVLETLFGGKSTLPQARAEAETEEMQVAAWIDRPSYRPYQKLRLNLALQVAQGFHVYAPSLLDGFVPLTIEVEPMDGMELGRMSLPAPRPMRIEGSEETFQVYEGTIYRTLPLVLTRNLGDVTLRVRIRYQACSDTVCFPPGEILLSLPIRGQDLVRD
jgi:peroxiredoxin